MNDASLNNLDQLLTLFRPTTLLLLLIGVLTLSVVVRTLRRGGDRLVVRFPAHRLLVLQSFNIAAFLVYMIGGTVLFFGILAPPRELMIAAAGGLAVAVGLSLKDVVASLIAGIILLFDRPFNVGDRVSFQGMYGEIESIGLRVVRMQSLNDDTITIPNSKFITEAVASGNFGKLTMMVTTDLHLHPSADLELATRLVYESVVTSRYAYVRQPTSIVVEQVPFGTFLAMRLTIKAYVIDVIFEKAFVTDIVKRCTSTLNERRIPWAGQPLDT